MFEVNVYKELLSVRCLLVLMVIGCTNRFFLFWKFCQVLRHTWAMQNLHMIIARYYFFISINNFFVCKFPWGFLTFRSRLKENFILAYVTKKSCFFTKLHFQAKFKELFRYNIFVTLQVLWFNLNKLWRSCSIWVRHSGLNLSW